MKRIYTKFLLMWCFMFSILAFAQSPIKKADLKTSKRTLNPQIQSIDQQNTTPENIKSSLQKVIDSYDHEKLNSLKEKFENKFSFQKNAALDYAKKNNIPVKLTNEDGSFAELQRILEDGTPIYYSTFNDAAAISTRANYLNTGGGLGLNLNGNGLIAHVWDGGHARISHQEYDGAGGNNRVILMDTGSEGGTQLNFHAAHVTGTIVASGVQAPAKGMAWQADAHGYMWNNDVSEATTAAANGMLVSNHSYGYIASGIPDGWFGQYGSDAVDWDSLMFNSPYYLMFVAAGNDGQDNSSNAAPLNGQATYDKLSGHATSKNNMVVANGNDANINGDGSLGSVTRNASSSEGPTDDYRIKPDIMGNGTGLYSTYHNSNAAYNSITGTSMASPNVCGSALLLQEHYNNLNGNFMRAATLKGLILHTADDTNATGPDAQTGWGLMNAKFAAETITTADGGGDAIVRELTIANGGSYQITIESDGVNPLLASISWTDRQGTQNNSTNSTSSTLVNDLDIRLENGTTFSPWRLTGVTTNGTGDNTRDPYERIDVNGAAGFYTLTVTHKGSLTGGFQNFSLVVTGAQESAATPQIGFNSTLGNTIEGSDCGFVDVQVPVSIAQGASQNADVSFTLNGGTATQGVDFDLMTSSVTFNAGSTASQNMMIRIYNDGFVEGDETFVVDLSVDANGGDAAASSNADSITFTITDDDYAPSASQTTTIFSDDMDDIVSTGWSLYDANSDGQIWQYNITGITLAGVIEGNFWLMENDLTILDNGDGATGTAAPNDYVISPAITIPANANSVDINFAVGSLNTSEHWGLYWFTDYTVAGLNSATLLAEGDTAANTAGITTVNVPGIAGETGYVTLRHFNSAGNAGGLLFDTFSVNSNITTPIQTATNNGTTNDQMNLPGLGTVYTSDSASGDIMLDITNNSTFDYGCVDIAVARAGTGAQDYNGSTAPNLVMDKTFYINPTNSSTSGDVSITFYFTEAEIAGWEAVTGLSRTALTCLRDDAGAVTFAPDQNAINATETSNLTVGSFGTGVTLTGTFTGLTGGFVFGPNAAFQSLCFSPKVFLQGPLLTSGGTLMDDSLRAAGSIPTSSPYPDAVSAPAAVFNTTGNDAIVDWVWIELREVGNNTNVLASTSALVQRDGDVVNYVDGTGTLKFGLADGNYILAIQHRNHLGVMSETLALDSACKVIDFTNGSVLNFGANAQTSFGLPSGISALWAGDVLGNNQIKFLGASNDGDSVKDLVLAAPANIFNDITYEYPGYFVNDVSLNGVAKFSGSSNDVDLIKDNVLAHPGNIFNDPTYTIVEQLP